MWEVVADGGQQRNERRPPFVDICPFRLADNEWVALVEEEGGGGCRWMHLAVVVRTNDEPAVVLEIFDPVMRCVALNITLNRSSGLTRLSGPQDDQIHFYELEQASGLIALQFVTREDADTVSKRIAVSLKEIKAGDPASAAEARLRSLERKGFAAKDILWAQQVLGRHAESHDLIDWIFDNVVEGREPPPSLPTTATVQERSAEELVAAWAATHTYPENTDDADLERADAWSVYSGRSEVSPKSPSSKRKPPPPPPPPTKPPPPPSSVNELSLEQLRVAAAAQRATRGVRRGRRRPPPPPKASPPPIVQRKASSSSDDVAAEVTKHAERAIEESMERARASRPCASSQDEQQHQEERRAVAVKDNWATLVDFVPLRTLGSGAFSIVVLVQRRPSSKGPKAGDEGHFYAMKIMRKQQILKAGLEHSIKIEREVLRVVKHPFLVQLRYAFQTAQKLYLITDFYAAGSLDDVLKRHGRRGLGVSTARFLIAELALGLSHLHSQYILHRDVKAANVLLDIQGHAHLADYGLAKIIPNNRGTRQQQRRKMSFAGTLEYMAPEFIAKNQTVVGAASDWWALGCLLAETAQGSTPFRADTPRQLMHNILKADPVVTHAALRPILLEGLLIRDPNERLADLVHVTNHPFFQPIDFAKLERKAVQPPYAPQATPTNPDSSARKIFKEHYFDQDYPEVSQPQPIAEHFISRRPLLDGSSRNADAAPFLGNLISVCALSFVFQASRTAISADVLLKFASRDGFYF